MVNSKNYQLKKDFKAALTATFVNSEVWKVENVKGSSNNHSSQSRQLAKNKEFFKAADTTDFVKQKMFRVALIATVVNSDIWKVVKSLRQLRYLKEKLSV